MVCGSDQPMQSVDRAMPAISRAFSEIPPTPVREVWPLLGGSYGIGPGRVMAAIVEQRGDEKGIVWPASISPYDAHVIALPGAEEIAAKAAGRLSAEGRSVLLDDRDARAGEKFADADLIGIPLRITAGKKSLADGAVDVVDRASGTERRLPAEEVAA